MNPSHVEVVECVCVVPRGSRMAPDPSCESCAGTGLLTVCDLCSGLGRVGDAQCWRCEGNGFETKGKAA